MALAVLAPAVVAAPMEKRETPAAEASVQTPQASPAAPESQQGSAEAGPAAPQPQAAPQPPQAPPEPTLVARIDLAKQQMTVQENGRLIRTWRISSGRDGYPTPRGTFRAEWTTRMWYSRQYDMAPMPYAVFFKNGSAIHGTTETGRLGRPASHGCVRLATAHAAEFYKLVGRHGIARTRIIVQGNPPVDRLARRERRGGPEYSSYRGRGYDSSGYGWSPSMGWSAPSRGYGYGYSSPYYYQQW